jgi:hypothetical protein
MRRSVKPLCSPATVGGTKPLPSTPFSRWIEQLPLSTQTLAPDGRLLQVNHTSETLLGISVDELSHRHSRALEDLSRADYGRTKAAMQALTKATFHAQYSAPL